MARLVLVGFPPAPDGPLGWCAWCCILAKGTLIAPQMEHVEAGLADQEAETFRVGVDPRKARELVNEAVAVVPLPQLRGAMAGACWLHMPAMDGNAPAAGEQEQPGPGLIVPGNDPRKRGQS